MSFGVESNDADNAAIDTLLNDPTTGILTLAQQTEDQLLANFAPTVVDEMFATSSVRTVDAASGVLANDSGGTLDGTLTATLLAAPTNGAVTLNSDGSFTYTANAGFLGTDTFTYTVTDAFGATAEGTATIIVEELSLVLDTTMNSAVISNDTLIVNDSNFVVGGTTSENATVEVDSDGDGQFDDGTTTADAMGIFSLTVPLLNNAANLGANNIQVRATNDIFETIKTLDVHFAVGTVVRFTTPEGTYDVELLDTDAPQTVTAFLDDLGRYDNSIVHRNPSDFVIQGGGFTVDAAGTIAEVPDFTAPPNEFNSANLNNRGTLSTAQIGGDINSFTGQWFVNVVDNNFLDVVPHTVFGRVIGSGMNIVDQINQLPTLDLRSETGESAFSDLPLQNYTPLSQGLTGTVSVDAGTSTVTGTGTAFQSEAGVGFAIQIAGEQFTVASIASDTELVLSANHVAGATAATAQINPTPTQDNYILSPISQLF
jgi:cyclophilin family peptidyl-prolyl cis-trans isomerase